jgi:hypothetical protein
VADDLVKHVYTLEQLQAGVSLPTDKRHLIVIRTPQLIVRLLANPSTPLGDQKFTLIGGTTLESPRYKQTLSGNDDLIKGDEYLDLKFTKLVPGLSYWLEVDPGGSGAKYLAFETVPWTDIKAD